VILRRKLMVSCIREHRRARATTHARTNTITCDPASIADGFLLHVYGVWCVYGVYGVSVRMRVCICVRMVYVRKHVLIGPNTR